ncbi:PP2C family protein-serine/threonine phosphatase [Desulfotomaculum copahuensis]|uniref:PP2C family protein-serine/threonine phosphatase n=1 Tax=Desulfotomaculum copahuensis TaxID=1838280 RepID=UPI001372902D|nr:SpoIIE family protein phosphatase [Desulfotomaculum copahuensis]
MHLSRRLRAGLLYMAAAAAAVAALVISLSNSFLQGVTLEQQLNFYLPVVLGQCLFVVLALYTISVVYLKPVFGTLDLLSAGRPVADELAAAARRASFNYPLDMLIFLTLCGAGLSLIFHAAEWLFFYRGNIPAHWWVLTFQNAAFELTLAVSLGMFYFAFSRRLLREPLELTTGLAPDEGKRLTVKGRLLLIIISLFIINVSSFFAFYLLFPLSGRSVPAGLYLAYTLLLLLYSMVAGLAVAADTGADILLVARRLAEMARGAAPGRHQTLTVTSLDEVGDLVAAFNRLQQQVARVYRNVDRELALARAVQKGLLPREFPALPGWEAAAVSRPARQVGGDFYDFVSLPEGRFGLLVGDAAGKGMPAALLMAAVVGILRAEAPRGDSPAAVLSKVNDLVCSVLAGGMFVTVLYAVFEPASGRCTLASAGHMSPVRFFAGGGEPELVTAGALPLGLEQGVTYRDTTLTIPPGGGIAFYSDGLVEARDKSGELFGFPRFLRLFHSAAATGGESFIAMVMDEVERFAGGEPADDLTLLLLRRAGTSGGEKSPPASGRC